MGARVAATVDISLVLDAAEGNDDCANTGVAMINHVTIKALRHKAIARDMGHDVGQDRGRAIGQWRSTIRLIG